MNVATSAHGRLVMVVEDEMFVAMLVEDILSNAGYRVIKASRVDSALDLVAGNDAIDVALLDINLNGVEVLSLIHI